jgi:hypothetical protein
VRIRPEVAHGTVIGDIGAAVRTKPDVGRTVETSRVVCIDERLVTSSVLGKVLDVQGWRLIRVLIEIDQPDLVANFRRWRCRIRWREPEIAL